MANVHERLFVTARNLLTLSADESRLHRYLESAQNASAALGMYDFLAEDPDTPDEMRSYVKRVRQTARNRVSKSHANWIRSRIEPRLSGKRDIEIEADEYAENLDRGFREAIRAAIDEVENGNTPPTE